MRTPQVGGADLKVQTGLLGQCKAVGDAVVIGLHAQQACHQRTIRAVATACGGKAAIEQDLGLGRRAVLPMRTAPAVWLLDGPVITGPSTSIKRIAGTSA